MGNTDYREEPGNNQDPVRIRDQFKHKGRRMCLLREKCNEKEADVDSGDHFHGLTC